MANNITLKQVKEEALESIKLLREGKIEIKTASEIRNNLNVIIDAAKTEVDFIKTLPEEIKQKSFTSLGDYGQVADTLISPEIPLEESLKQIEDKNKVPYTFNQ